MSGAGSALMGIGSSRGDDRAVAAAEMAISSPLLEASIDGAHGVLLSIQGGSDLGLFEINEAAQLVANSAASDANIIFGAVIDDALGDEVRVTVIAAGFDDQQPSRPASVPTSAGNGASGIDGVKFTASTPSGKGGSASSAAPSTASPAAWGRGADTSPASTAPASPGAGGSGGSASSSGVSAPSALTTPTTPTTANTPSSTRPGASTGGAGADGGATPAASVSGIVVPPAGSSSSGYVPSPVSFDSTDSDDDFGGTSGYAAPSLDDRGGDTAPPTSASAWRDPARAVKQDKVFDVNAGRRRPVVFEEDDDLDVPDFLK
jgi:cell division protein FtsZ